MTGIIDAEEAQNESLHERLSLHHIFTMKFHFVRTADSDITVTGKSLAECTQKAFDERMKQVTPTKIQGEVIE